MSEEIQDIEVERIFLYEDNPRHEKLESQEEIIDYLCQDEQVLELAKSICEEGINPLELVGLVEKAGTGAKGAKKTYEVWEGNRRICAIQLLKDPERAPLKQREKFERLAQDCKPIIRVKSVVFVDRNRLKFWIKNIHWGEQGGVGRKPWNADAKARSQGSHSRNVLALELLDLAEDFEFITAEQRKNRLTTFDRYVSNAKVKDVLGIDNKDPQDIKTDLTDNDFKDVLKVIIDDLINEKITSRHNSDVIYPYARDLPGRAGVSTERVESRSITNMGNGSVKAETDKSKPKLQIPTLLTNIEPFEKLQELLEQHENTKLSQLYYSLCKVNAKDHTQLIALGCWAFIETLTAHVDRTEKTSFVKFYSKARLSEYGFKEPKRNKSITACLERLSEAGNTTKHHPEATTLNYAQLINDMKVVTKLLIATLEKNRPLLKDELSS